MGDGIDEAAIDERQAIGVEGCRNGDAIGAVAIEQARGRSVQRRILAVKQGDRHALAVPGRREDATGDIVILVMARRHFLRLQERALARRHVVIEELRGRRHRRIGKADDVGIVFPRARQAERIGLLGKGDGVFLAGLAVAHDDTRQALVALQPDEMTGECHMAEDQRAGPVRHDFRPVFAARRRHRRLHDLEVLGAVGIGQDVEDVAALGHRIFQPRLARGDDNGRRREVFGGEQAVFARLVVVDIDIDEVVDQRAADGHEEAGILLLIDQPVVFLPVAEDVVEDLRGAVVLVKRGVEEAPRIRRPDTAAAGVRKRVGAVLAGREVAHLQREIFRSLVVIAPDADGMVGRMVDAGEAEIVLAFGLLVAVEQDDAFAAVARLAEIARLLPAGDIGRAVGIGAILHGHGAVVLLDAAAHLGKQRLLQGLRIGHRRRHIGVLGLQMRADLRLQDRGILEHGLPVVVTKPGIVVGAGDAVARILLRVLGSNRGGGQVLEDGHDFTPVDRQAGPER